jgi:two-component system sensor histidine kinase RegB
VRDHGPGMSPEILARVGEPFFTTKPTGRGMGLGLFLARTVVERLGGALTLDSGGVRGTTARIAVPLRAGPGT